MSSPPRVFRFTLMGRFKLAKYPLALSVILVALLAFSMRFGTWTFWLVLGIAGLLFVRSLLYLFKGNARIVIADEGIERYGLVARFEGAKVTLRTKKEGSVAVVEDVVVRGAPLPNGATPSVVFDRTLEDFVAAVEAVVMHVPDEDIEVLCLGQPLLTPEEKAAILAPFKGDPVQRALAQLGRPGAMASLPPHLRN